MSFKLEDLPYQRQAIDSVVRLFDGQQRNYFDLDLSGDCFSNRLAPFAANNQRLVKKIEALSVAEISDEATLKTNLLLFLPWPIKALT